jgi:Tol biopolymer transport system component
LTASANVRTPWFSRDGKRIVFVRGGTMDSEIATVATEGGLITTVLASSMAARNFKTPQYSPDGTRIVFGFDEGTQANVGIVNADGTGFVKLANGGLAQSFPSFTPDGLEVVTAAGGVGLTFNQLQKVVLATNSVAPVTNFLGNEAQGIQNRVVVSPDGTKAAFDARVSTGSTRLFVIDLSTKLVTSPFAGDLGTNDTFPCWMGNSTLAFSSDSGGSDNVYKVNLPSDQAALLVPKAIEPSYFAAP